MSQGFRGKRKPVKIVARRDSSFVSQLQDVLSKNEIRACITEVSGGVARISAKEYSDWVLAKKFVSEAGWKVERV